MTSAGGRTAAAILALTLAGCSGRPEARPAPAGGNPPTASTTPDSGAIRPGPGADTTPAAAAPVEQRSAGGIFGVPPAGVAAAPTMTAPSAAGRTDPAAVARAYAAGLYTVDWARPLPGAQRPVSYTHLTLPTKRIV